MNRIVFEVGFSGAGGTVEDELTRRYTAFDSFDSMVNALGGYRPTLRVKGWPTGTGILRLADAYDAAQAKRGDPRRANRY